MRWLLPLTFVLLVALLLAGVHFVFMRWMTRRPEPAPIRDSEPQERSDGTLRTRNPEG